MYIDLYNKCVSTRMKNIPNKCILFFFLWVEHVAVFQCFFRFSPVWSDELLVTCCLKYKSSLSLPKAKDRVVSNLINLDCFCILMWNTSVYLISLWAAHLIDSQQLSHEGSGYVEDANVSYNLSLVSQNQWLLDRWLSFKWQYMKRTKYENNYFVKNTLIIWRQALLHIFSRSCI